MLIEVINSSNKSKHYENPILKYIFDKNRLKTLNKIDINKSFNELNSIFKEIRSELRLINHSNIGLHGSATRYSDNVGVQFLRISESSFNDLRQELIKKGFRFNTNKDGYTKGDTIIKYDDYQGIVEVINNRDSSNIIKLAGNISTITNINDIDIFYSCSSYLDGSLHITLYNHEYSYNLESCFSIDTYEYVIRNKKFHICIRKEGDKSLPMKYSLLELFKLNYR